MRLSIRSKMILILVTILGGVLFLTWFLNVTFAEKYYISTEEKAIIQTFQSVKDNLEKEEDMSQIFENLDDISNRTNVKMMVSLSTNTLFGQEVIFSNMPDGTRSYEEIFNYLARVRNQLMARSITQSKNKPFDHSRIYHSRNNEVSTLVTDGYYVTMLTDQMTKQNGLYLFGFTDNEYLVAMRVSIEGIRTSVDITSKFLSYMSIVAVFLGICIVSIYAYRFTKPIKEMAQVANRMTELDFDARVKELTNDEIGELGSSINKLSSNLESTIAELKRANLELQQDIQKKEEIDEMRKEFLSHVSHELKTPIAIIQGYAEGLKDGIIDDPESMEFYCDVIMDESKKMNQMVRKLLTLNQLEFGNTPLNITRFDLREMIQNKIQSSSILYSKNDVNVIFEEKEAVYVWADEFMIEEVFSNYMTNAIHYVAEGGDIRIWFEKKGNSVRTNVYNQGNPIPEEELEKLWIKFYKVDKARSREYGGNGIGLSIVAAAMKAHNKDFGVYNKEDGVVFYFDLDTET